LGGSVGRQRRMVSPPSPSGHPMVTAPGFSLRERRARRPQEEGVEEVILKKRLPEKLFINLSSTAALIRHLFALNAVIAAIELNKIHIDPFSPEQTVGGSNQFRCYQL